MSSEQSHLIGNISWDSGEVHEYGTEWKALNENKGRDECTNSLLSTFFPYKLDTCMYTSTTCQDNCLGSRAMSSKHFKLIGKSVRTGEALERESPFGNGSLWN